MGSDWNAFEFSEGLDFCDPRSKHLDPLVDATARNLKDIQMPQFPPKHRFPFPACGILQGSHKGSGHQLELAVLFEIPALVHLGHEDLQVDTNDTMFMTLVHLIWWKYSENCLSIYIIYMTYAHRNAYAWSCSIHLSTQKLISHPHINNGKTTLKANRNAKRPQSVRCPPGTKLQKQWCQ